MAFSASTGGVTTEGLNHTNDVVFHGTTPVSPWYIGLVDDTPTFALADTLASHAGWTELAYATKYTGNRKEWTEGASAAGVTTNAATVDFAILDTITCAGAFLCGAATLTAAVLWGEGTFTGGDKALSNGDTLKVTITDTTANA